MDPAVMLAGDVGGTKTYLALCRYEAGTLVPQAETRCTTAEYASLGELLRAFLVQTGCTPARLAVGVPGPVRQLPVRAVNLPWLIDPQEVQRTTGVEHVHLLNDLEATAYGTRALAEQDVLVLNRAAADPEGNVAVIAAGTGLGEGGLCWSGSRYVAIASEGGHASFSPTGELEVELWRYLKTRFGHVSWERVVSGPGLNSIYSFLRDSGRGEEPGWIREELASAKDQAGVISQAALEDHCPLAERALDLFVSLYGAEAGNLALKFMATGGVYVAGGIAPKIASRLQGAAFMQAFLDKGRMGPPLQAVPVSVVLNDKTALLGAAYRCAQLEGLT
ncbi:MAG: glucokinase [Candidatus Latescibacterota bacterium]